MKALVVCDSRYGNTWKIAEAVSSGLARAYRVTTVTVDDFSAGMLGDADLVLFGSPTQGWRPTRKTISLFEEMRPGVFLGKNGAAFDTGLHSRFSGSAAKGIERRLRGLGCRIIAYRQRFFVGGVEGPLDEGEIERARAWGASIAELAAAREAA